MNIDGRLKKSTVLLGFITSSAISMFVVSCGLFDKSNNDAVPTTLPIPIKLISVANQNTSLDLGSTGSNPGVPVTSYNVSVDGCSSGLTATSADGAVIVYLGDTGCVAKLLSFTADGKTFSATAPGATNFVNWSPNQSAIFANILDSKDLASVQIASQLSSPIIESDFVSFNVYFKISGSNTNIVLVNNSQSIYVAGQVPPNFIINPGDAIFTGVDDSGAGTFVFTLTCASGPFIVGGHSPDLTFCPNSSTDTFASGNGVDIYAADDHDSSSHFSYKLVADVNGDGSLTFDQAREAFASGDYTVDPANLTTDSFTTTPLIGPGLLANTSIMILILQAKNTNPAYAANAGYSSFLYFAVKMSQITP